MMILDKIENHWPLFFEGLAQVQKKNPTDGRPDEVIQACMEERAFLFVAPSAEAPDGFAVLEPCVIDGEKAVHIWIAYSRVHGFNKKYVPFMEQKAREIGAVKITTNSTRKAYKRQLTDCINVGSFYTRYL